MCYGGMFFWGYLPTMQKLHFYEGIFQENNTFMREYFENSTLL